MFCKSCGKTLNNDAKFCPFCGAQTAAGAAAGGTAGGNGGFKMPEHRVPGRGKGLLLGVAAAALVVCVGAGVVLSGVLGSPQDKVEKALGKTMAAFSQTAERMGLTTLTDLQEKQAYSMDLSVSLSQLPADLSYYYDASVLEGIGVRLGTDVNLESRALAYSASAFYGSADLVRANLALEDTVLTVYSPEFLGDSALGLNTVTLGEDLSDLDPDNRDMYKDISFNLFDILDKFTQTPQGDEEALKALREAIEVEETGKETVEVNGSDVDCTGYAVLIPEDALRDYLDAMEDSIDAMEMEDAIIDLLESMGVPDNELDSMRDELREAASGGAMFDALKEAVKAMGDVELQVYLSDGYLMAVEWEPRIEDTRLEVGLYFGGGDVYEDQWSLVISGGGMELLVESEGDHTADSGRYTDVTTITVSDGGSSFELESELEYEPGADSDNFYWSLQADEFSMVAEGQLTADKDAFSLVLDNLEFQAYGKTVLGLELEYSIRPYEKRDTGAQEVLMIADLSSSDLEDLAMDIQGNAESWVYDLMDEIPALQELMWYL